MAISNELRVGIMFFTGLLLLVLLIATMTRWGQRRGGYNFTIRFSQAQGVLEGADVRVAGVKVGQVTSVSLDPPTNEALVGVRVDNRVQLYHNYVYTIGIGGLVGERYIEIRPTDAQGQLVTEGDKVQGTTSADLNAVIDSASALITKLSTTTESLNAVIGDEQNQQNIKVALENLQKASVSSAQFAEQLNQMVKRNQGAIDLIVVDLMTVSGDIRRVSETLTPQLENTALFSNLDLASENVVVFTERLAGLSRAVEVVVSDPEISATLKATIANLQEASAELERAMEQVRIASEDLPAVSENVKQASADLPVITGNVKAASADLPEITRPFKEIAPATARNVERLSQELRETSETVSGVAERIVKAGESLGSIKLQPEARIMALPKGEQNSRSDVNVNVRGDNTMMRLGIADIGNDSKLNLQFGNKLRNDLWFRYGIVQSNFGVGADYTPSNALRVSGELFDPERFRGNAIVDYRLRQLGEGWWFSAAWYDIFDNNDIGVGLTYQP